MKKLALVLLISASAQAQIPAFPLTQTGLAIERPTQPTQPFTVAGPRGILVGTQDGQFESWVFPVKLLSHLTIEASVEGYSVPISVNQQSATIEVRPDHTTITYSHIAFTLRQIMFSPDICASSPELAADLPGSAGNSSEGAGAFRPLNQPRKKQGALAPEGCSTPSTGPIVLFQIDSLHPVDLTFRFTPEMRWMWPKRNDGIPGAEWTSFASPSSTTASELLPPAQGYTLHMDYPDLAGAIAIPTATPGIMAPYQERPQVHPLELHLHYDPKIDGTGPEAKFFPLLMAVGTTKETATNAALGQQLQNLNAEIPEAYKAHAASYARLQSEATTIETPDKALNEAFNWGVVSIEQLKAHEFATNQDALVAGYYASADSARPGFGWFFGRDALYTLYAVNGFGDFALTRSELEFLSARLRPDGKIMHEFAQTAGDPAVNWKSFPYMYAAADATPLFLMAMRDYYRASGDLAFLQKHRETIEKAWAFETAPTSDTDHDGIYDNSQGTGWVESWPHDKMPHQEVYLALLDEQASRAYSAIEDALSGLPKDPAQSERDHAVASVASQHSAELADDRAEAIKKTIESEYYDKEKGCYAFSHNQPGDPNGETDRSTTVYPAIAWWDDERIDQPEAMVGPNWRIARAIREDHQGSEKSGNGGLVTGHDFSRADKAKQGDRALAPEAKSGTDEKSADTKGTGFSPYIKPTNKDGALAPQEKPIAREKSSSTKGTGFSPYIKPTHENGASAPEGLDHPDPCLTQFASPTLATDWGLRDIATSEPFYDGMSYHQGSVWPLFTGWAALADYRGNQPLAGEQMLMQNVDLTWAQDPGAVTELLSGDFFVPFGRSTSHQLWSSSMVITPTLRGLFGISLDAATNTITVNPHLPANWDHAEVSNLRLGMNEGNLHFWRKDGQMHVIAEGLGHPIKIRSDLPGATSPTRSNEQSGNATEISIPLPPIQIFFRNHSLPEPGSRASQPKLLAVSYRQKSLALEVTGPAGSDLTLGIQRNKDLDLKAEYTDSEGSGAVSDDTMKELARNPKSRVYIQYSPKDFFPAESENDPPVPMHLSIHFPEGEGWQTTNVTLTW